MIFYSIYLIVFFLYLPGIYWIFHRNLLIKCPIISVYMISSFVFVGIGALYMQPYLDFSRSIFLYLPYIVMLYLQPLIFYAIYFLYPFKKFSTINWERKHITRSLSFHKNNIYILWGISFTIILYYIYNNGLPLGYDLQNWFIGDIRGIRQENTYIKRFWIIREGFYNLPIIATVYSLVVWKFYRRRRLLVLLILSFFFTIVLSFSFLFKKFLLLLFVFLFMASFLAEKNLSIKKVFALAIVSIVSLSVFFAIYLPNRDDYFFLLEIFHRITIPYTHDMLIISEYVIKSGQYFWGTTLINPIGIFPFEPINLSRVTMEIKSGYYGNAPVPFLGEGFANFSWWGIFIFWFLVFLFLFLISYSCNLFDDNISCIIITILILYNTFDLAFTSINTIFSPVLYFKLIFFGVLLTKFNFK